MPCVSLCLCVHACVCVALCACVRDVVQCLHVSTSMRVRGGVDGEEGGPRRRPPHAHVRV